MPIDASSGTACLTQPSTGGPWTKYLCSACYGGTCMDSECNIGAGRRRLLDLSCAAGDPCLLSLAPNTTSRSVQAAGSVELEGCVAAL